MSFTPTTNSTTSIVNSTSVPLTAGSTFTGAWEDITKYAKLIVAPTADQNGVVYVDFSPDGVNADSTLTKFYNTPDIEAPHAFTITRKYARVRFVNDSGVDQTYLRLQTSLKVSSNDLNVPLDQAMARDYDSISVRPYDYRTEVALGLRQGHVLWNKHGYNLDIDGAAEVIASFGGTFTPLLVASTLSFISSSAADTIAAGTGARTIRIYGIDENRRAQVEDVDLNGDIIPAVTLLSWLGVNRVEVIAAGSNLTNVGTISGTAVTDASNQAQLPAGKGRTQQCMFFTQMGHHSLIEWLLLNAIQVSGGGGAPVIVVTGWVYDVARGVKEEVFRIDLDTAVDNIVPIASSLPLLVQGPSSFWIEASTDTPNTGVNVRFGLIEVKDSDTD